ncbi:FKBP-type peptidyl-prolyl cis-trans isomerase [Streptacidiphilus albus]|uniref:FKBP-type peptidyl-prolyl cis-trans isomerase n=1 Tax=Streptacidiphilus albus TaxID=105425 RepID=UPI0005A8186C|nr:FKBP-type peptidyl-prolyl cis-trans isomerase [Streptacidiphilus albus]
MRRTTAAAALLLVPALFITGCSSSSGSKSADAKATALPTVTGVYGKSATIKLPDVSQAGTTQVVKTLTTGTGTAVGDGDVAITKVVIDDWNTGKTVSDSYAAGQPLVTDVSNMLPALKSAVSGHTIGSRVLVVAPPADAASQIVASEQQEAQQAQQEGQQAPADLGVRATDTMVMVVDITGAVSTKGQASGAAQAPVAGMPTVDASAPKAATITIPKGAKAPTSLQTSVLVKGAGPKVASGQSVIVQYTGVTWADGKVFDSSWNDQGAFNYVAGGGNVIKGWDQAILGQTVGSRVEIVIPPALGYGATAQGSIPANSTLVFVVDILAAA